MRYGFAAVALCVAGSVAAACGPAANGSRTIQPRMSSAASVEQSDAELRDALLQVAVRPSADSHRKVAERYRALGVLDFAHRHFSRAVKLDARDAASHDGLARIWRDWGAQEQALTSAYRAVFHAPQWASAHNTLGTVLQALGRRSDAKAAYERAMKLDTRAAYAKSNLCYVVFLEGHLDSAMEHCRAALEIDPASKAARNNLALAHAAAGRLDLAYETFAGGASKAEALFNMGIVYMARGEYSEAAKAFDAAGREAPSMAAARSRASDARRRAAEALKNNMGDPK